ncbi:MAG: methylated-DNA--[protein]-cysteine S-methyltransferase, partial [Chitinispirillaceae bacterium]
MNECERVGIDHSIIKVDLIFHHGADGLKVGAVLLNGRESVSHLPRCARDMALSWAGDIRRVLDGTCRDLSHIPLCLDRFTPFQKRVLLAARSLERGRVVSYSTLARLAGFPKAVRAAASVMARNPFPLIIPCHQVIRSDGSVGGFMGEVSGEKVELKRRLLGRHFPLSG